jgi:hypothetical protein
MRRVLLAMVVIATACANQAPPLPAPVSKQHVPARLLRQSSPLVCDATRVSHLEHSSVSLTAWMTKALTIHPTARGVELESVSLFEGQRRVFDPGEHLYVYGPNDVPAQCTVYAKEIEFAPRMVRPRPLAINGVRTAARYSGRHSLASYTVTLTLDDPRLSSIVCVFNPSDGLRASADFVTDDLTLAELQRLLAPGGLDFGDDPLACKVPVVDLSDAVYNAALTHNASEVTTNDAPLESYRSYVTMAAISDDQKSAYDCAVMGVKREVDNDAEMSQAFSEGAKRYLSRYLAAMRGALGDLDKLGCADLTKAQVYDGTQALLRELDARDHAH